MMSIRADHPLAVAATQAIQSGDSASLRRLLGEHPELATTRIIGANDEARTLLHVATDRPGHFPNGAATVAILVEAGADVNAPFIGRHGETPLHWAASSDDVEVLDALIDAGADIEAPGAVIGGGTPLADAVAFGQWSAARRLVERGARLNLWQAAALGSVAVVIERLSGPRPPQPDEIAEALWCACHGGQRATAELMLERGADINWVGYDKLTPLDAARRSGADDLAEWLRRRGARTAAHKART